MGITCCVHWKNMSQCGQCNSISNLQQIWISNRLKEEESRILLCSYYTTWWWYALPNRVIRWNWESHFRVLRKCSIVRSDINQLKNANMVRLYLYFQNPMWLQPWSWISTLWPFFWCTFSIPQRQSHIIISTHIGNDLSGLKWSSYCPVIGSVWTTTT